MLAYALGRVDVDVDAGRVAMRPRDGRRRRSSIFAAIWIVGVGVAVLDGRGRRVANAFTYGGSFLPSTRSTSSATWLRRLSRLRPAVRASSRYFPALYMLGQDGSARACPRALRVRLARSSRSPRPSSPGSLWRGAVRHYRSAGVMIELDGLRKKFVVRTRAGGCGAASGRSPAVDGISLRVERGRDGRLHRAERRRQVDDDQDADRRSSCRRRARRGGRARAVAAAHRAGAADRRRVRPAHPALVGPAAARLVRAAAPRLPGAGRPATGRASRGSASCSSSTRSSTRRCGSSRSASGCAAS